MYLATAIPARTSARTVRPVRNDVDEKSSNREGADSKGNQQMLGLVERGKRAPVLFENSQTDRRFGIAAGDGNRHSKEWFVAEAYHAPPFLYSIKAYPW